MSTSIPAEFQTFCYAIMLGAACQLLYEILRIFMKVFIRSVIIISLIDIGFWIIAAVCMFVFMYQENGGILRGYGIFGMAAGMILLELSIGDILVRYISRFLEFLVKKLKLFVKQFIKIIKRLLKIGGKPLTIILAKWKKLWNRKVRDYERSKKKKKSHKEE